MSRKHFKALAEAIKSISNEQERERVANLIAEVCASQNPRFSFTTFYRACGVKG
jgi:Ca2+-binding EF-hand superfamily protein